MKSKKLVSFIVALIMVLTLIPAGVFAAGNYLTVSDRTDSLGTLYAGKEYEITFDVTGYVSNELNFRGGIPSAFDSYLDEFDFIYTNIQKDDSNNVSGTLVVKIGAGAPAGNYENCRLYQWGISTWDCQYPFSFVIESCPHNTYEYTADETTDCITAACTGCGISYNTSIAAINATYTDASYVYDGLTTHTDASFPTATGIKFFKETETTGVYGDGTSEMPTTAGNYKVELSAGGVSVSQIFTIVKATTSDLISNLPATITDVYDGSEKVLATEGTCSVGTFNYLATTTDATPAIDDALWDTSVPTATDAGEYNVWYKVVGDANHEDITPTRVGVSTISKADVNINVITLTDAQLVYNGLENKGYNSFTAVLSNNEFSVADKVTVSYTSGGAACTTPTDVGTYKATFIVASDTNLNATSTDIEFEITKTNSIVTDAPATRTDVYDGKETELLSSRGTCTGGELQFFASETDVTDFSNVVWSVNTPTAINAGTYNIWYRVVGDHNHKDIEQTKIGTSTIEKKELLLSIDDKGMTAGDAVPVFTYVLSGFENEETAETVLEPDSIKLKSASDGKTAGTFDITVDGDLPTLTNYTISLSKEGKLTVIEKIRPRYYYYDYSYYTRKKVTDIWKDVLPNQYYTDALQWVYDYSIMKPVADDLFGVGRLTTRSEMIQAFYKAAGSPKLDETVVLPFMDVTAADECYKAVLWAYETGITSGIDGYKHFNPEGTIDRAQIVTLLWKYEGSREIDFETTFVDVAEGVWYTDAIKWAQKNGVVEGIDSTHFNPAGIVVKQDVAALFYNYFK